VKASLLTLAVSALFAPVNGNDTEIPQLIASSAMAHFQSFTPGVTNTIRNRVIGSENVGTKPIGIACAFEVDAGTMTVDGVQSVSVFLNNHGTAPFDVSCTVGVGVEGPDMLFASKTTTVDVGTSTPVQFDPQDVGLTDGFGDYLIGLTCMLPPKSIVNDTYVAYAVDNGDGL
jgi:hypothetical protein